MKLFRCRKCKSLVSITGPLALTCRCAESWARSIMGTKVVQVNGPCTVYALKDKELKEGGGRYWKVKEPNEQVRRLDKSWDYARDEHKYRKENSDDEA